MEIAISQIETLHRSILPQQLQSTRRKQQQEQQHVHRRCRFLPTNYSSSSSSVHCLPRLQHRIVPSEPVVDRLHPLDDVVDSCEDGLDSDGLLAETITKSIPSYILTADSEGFLANVTVIYERFHDMGLQYNLVKGMCDYGLVEPNDVQQMGIVPFCEGRDVILLARSGKGKTTTRCGILQQLDYGNAECQALVLVPTTELAEQIEKVMQALGYFLGVKVHACVGGTSVREDQRILSSGVHVVVGALQGHVFDMLRGQSLRPDYIKTFVLDEACEMFSQGFEDQIHDIFELLPSKVQVGVSSATMHPEALDITTKFIDNPMKIELIESDELNLLADITQFYVNVEKEEMKFEALCDLYKIPATTQSVIFVNTNRKVDWLADKIRGCGHAVSTVHRDMDESSGYTNMDEFVNGSSRVLITTDQLALCVDVLQVPVIVNYDMPIQHEDYRIRIAGIGRDGGEGIAINFVTEYDKNMLSDICKLYNVLVKELPPNPSVVDLLLTSSSG